MSLRQFERTRSVLSLISLSFRLVPRRCRPVVVKSIFVERIKETDMSTFCLCFILFGEMLVVLD